MADSQDHLKTDDDVEEILRLAIRQSGASSDELRQRLEQSAQELGISPEQLAAAEAQYRAEQEALIAKDQAIASEKEDYARYRRSQRDELLQHIAAYVAVNGFLAFIDIRGGNGLSWAFWPMLGWGIGVFCHIAAYLFPNTDDGLKGFRKWRKRHGRRSV